MDRRDLLNGVNDFLSDSIVLPPGDFDKELLLPIIETAKMKKMNTKRHSTRTQSQLNERLNSDQDQQQTQSKYFKFYIKKVLLFFFFFLASKVLLCKCIEIQIFSFITKSKSSSIICYIAR